MVVTLQEYQDMIACCKDRGEGKQSDDLDTIDAILENFVDEVYSSRTSTDDNSPIAIDEPLDPPPISRPKFY